VFDAAGTLIALLDIDSDHASRFDEIDARHLERLVEWFAAGGRTLS
jgi:putative methionine-R-sulfoxide reductase with GAF domain